MSEGPSTVGVVDDSDAGEELAAALAGAGLEVTVGDPETVVAAAPDAVVAAGDRATADVVAAGPATPIVPIDAGPGIRSVPRDDVATAADALAAGDWELEAHAPLSVAVDGTPVATATFDVTLLTGEPARISEYEVLADGERLDGSRADGVVVATPAGSTGYARRIEAPILAPDTGVAVAWIAPFRTDPDRWVIDPDVLEIRVCREEASVDLHVDDRVLRSVAPGDVVELAPADPVDVAVLPASSARYG